MPTRADYRKCLIGADTPECYAKLWSAKEKSELSKKVKEYWD
jgi:hypothetical protein